MIGLDCNILVQLALADHPANRKTVEVVQLEANQGIKLVFPDLIVTEFLHVITDERRFSPPLTMAEALNWMEDFLENLLVKLLESTEISTQQTLIPIPNRKCTLAAKEFWSVARKKSDGYLKITRAMMTTPDAKRTSRIV